MEDWLIKTAWPMTPPLPFSAFHICFSLFGLSAAFTLAWLCRRHTEYASCSFWGFCSPFRNVINRCFCIILSMAVNTTGGIFHFSFAASPCISASFCPLQQNSAGSGKGCSVLLCTAIICPEVSSFLRLRTE